MYNVNVYTIFVKKINGLTSKKKRHEFTRND